MCHDKPALQECHASDRFTTLKDREKEIGSGLLEAMLDLRHNSQMWVIDEALARMNAELSIDLPKAGIGRNAA